MSVVSKELGEQAGHAQLMDSGIFSGEFQPLRDLAGFTEQAVMSQLPALRQLAHDAERLQHLSTWLRASVLKPLLCLLLTSVYNRQSSEAQQLAEQWERSGHPFHASLLEIEHMRAASMPTSLPAHLADGRRLLRVKRTGLPDRARAPASPVSSGPPGLSEGSPSNPSNPGPSSSSVPSASAPSTRRIVRVKRTGAGGSVSSTPSSGHNPSQGPALQMGQAPEALAANDDNLKFEQISVGSFEEHRWNYYVTGRGYPVSSSKPQTAKVHDHAARMAKEGERIKQLLAEQGWALQLVDAAKKSWLQTLLAVQRPAELGKGRDSLSYGYKYKKLSILYAWEILAPARRKAFLLQKQEVLERDMARAKKHNMSIVPVKSKLNKLSAGSKEMMTHEGWFLHATKPETVLPILSNGLSERMCGGAFGKGVYLAEDPEKADQYATPDAKYCADGLKDLHARLYRQGSGTRHPGSDVFYMFVVRAAAGIAVRTKDGEVDLDRPGRQVFASSDRRELCEVPDITPPLRFHSLVVELGGKISRFREFVHFHSDRFCVEYLIAYQRSS